MSEAVVRLSVFLGLLGVLLLAETLWPRRQRALPRFGRWLTNFSIVILDTIAVRALGALTAVGTALWASETGTGLLNQFSAPVWLTFAVAVIILDLSIYVQHWAIHKIPFLWRFHKIHHADRDFDVTTALRFHPVEIILSMLYKCAVVWALGPSVLAVIIFEVILNGMAMFNHANLKLPLWLDRLLRILIVTPDMHRVHHSVHPVETNSNYGFNLSVWDRLFKTYTAQPRDGHDDMTIGLSQYQDTAPARLDWVLFIPFRRE